MVTLGHTASQSALVAAYNSASDDDIAIALWVDDQCLIMRPPMQRTPPLLYVRVQPGAPRPISVGVRADHADICSIRRALPFKCLPRRKIFSR